MGDEINWLVSVLLGDDTVVRCALRVKRDALPGDCAMYPMEPENRRTIRSLLPEHVRAGGRVVGVEEIFAVHVPGETHTDSGGGIVIHRVETVVHEHLARRVDVAATASSIMQELHRGHVLMFREGCAGWVKDLIARWLGKTMDTAEQACGIARALVRSADGKTLIPPHGPIYPGVYARRTVGDLRRLLDDPLIKDGWPLVLMTGEGEAAWDVSCALLQFERPNDGHRLCLESRRVSEATEVETLDLVLWNIERWDAEKWEG